MLEGKRYGAAHWVCRNFLFFKSSDRPAAPIEKLSQLEAYVDPSGGGKPLMDLRGKLTLGELYLMEAFYRYCDWENVSPVGPKLDPAVVKDLLPPSKTS